MENKGGLIKVKGNSISDLTNENIFWINFQIRISFKNFYDF